jgi:hypothetical protein
VAADIYSLGRLMEYLFSYSTLTLGVQKVVRRATAKNPAKRYRSVAEMQKAFRKSAKTDVLGTLVKVAAVLLVLFFFYDIMGDDRSTADIVPPTEDTTYTRRPAVTPSNQAEEDPNALYSLSAIQEHIDTAYRNREVPTAEPYSSLESLDQNTSSDAKRNPTVERLFKKEFRKRAEAMISKIYTRDMMNGDESRFLKASTNCFTELDRVQRELGEQYGMDLVQSTRLSSEVITELTEAYKSKIRR